MFLVVVGVLLLAMKVLEKGPGAQLPWMWVLAPFVLALVWWQWNDASGRTSRKAMERDAQRKAERQQRQIDSLGMGARSRRRK